MDRIRKSWLNVALVSLAILPLVGIHAEAEKTQPSPNEIRMQMPDAAAFSRAAPQSSLSTPASHIEYESRKPRQEVIGRQKRFVPDVEALLGERKRENVSKKSRVDKLDNLLKITWFPDNPIYLQNTSIHFITPDVIGWRANVIDLNGDIVGKALLQILEDNSIVGTIDIADSSSFKVMPTGIDNIHEALEVLPGKQIRMNKNDVYAPAPED